MDRPSGHQAIGPSDRRAGTMLLWLLACAAIVLLLYEARTMIGSVLQPLVEDQEALQTDFHYYYEAATRFTGSSRSQLYNPDDDVIAGFAYPPPAIVPFLWLIWWPLGKALVILTMASYLALLAALGGWIAYLRRHGYAIDIGTMGAVITIAIASGPTYMNAIFGQVNAFMLLSAIFFISLAPRKPIESGLILALGAWLKIYPVLLAAIGAWDRRVWPALAYAAAAAAAIVFVLLPVVPFSAYRAFVFEVLPARADQTAIHITNQSLVAFLERFAYPADQFLYWTGEQAVSVGLVVRILNLAAAAGGVWWLRARATTGTRSLVLSNAGVMALIAVIAPLGWGHTYVMVLPLVITQLIALKGAPPKTAYAIFACVVALMIPAGRHLPLDFAPGFIQNLAYSRYLLATIALLYISSVQIGRTPQSRRAASA